MSSPGVDSAAFPVGPVVLGGRGTTASTAVPEPAPLSGLGAALWNPAQRPHHPVADQGLHGEKELPLHQIPSKIDRGVGTRNCREFVVIYSI